MNENELNKLKELLGKEWTDKEINEVLKRFPDLASDTKTLQQAFQNITQVPVPPLDPGFTRTVLDKIQEKKSWSSRWQPYLTWPRLTLASGLVAGGLLLFLLLPRWGSQAIQPGLQIVREEIGPQDQKIYQIRVGLLQPGAKQVTLAGDFSQWNEVELKKDKKGIFWAEFKVPEGTYAYGFRIDGKDWTPDPKASRIVADGFGGKNSLMNL